MPSFGTSVSHAHDKLAQFLIPQPCVEQEKRHVTEMRRQLLQQPFFFHPIQRAEIFVLTPGSFSSSGALSRYEPSLLYPEVIA